MRSTLTSVLAAGCLVAALAACGGDDGSGSSSDAPAEADSGLPASDQGDVDEPAPDLGGTTGIDDIDETLEELDIDIDDLEGLDLGELDIGDIEDLDDLDEMFEDVDEMLSGLGGGDGGAVIDVQGVTYTVEADLCFVQSTEFILDGPAAGSDGSPAWASVNYSVTTREEMAEFLDETMIETLFPEDSDVLVDMSVDVRVGATSRFDFTEDQPSWQAYGGDITFGDAVVDYEVSGNMISGSGLAEDSNGVVLEWGETTPIEFEAFCS